VKEIISEVIPPHSE